MIKSFAASAILALGTSSMALAGGLDRTGQSIGVIFETGNYAEFSFGTTDPSVSGQDIAAFNPAQTPSGNVGQSFNQLGAAIKYDINDQLSVALIYDQPWGADISYPTAGANPLAPGSIMLGGTQAFANSDAYTGLLRYKFNENFSVHGGIRYQEIDGNITLRGQAYGTGLGPGLGLNGYNVSLERDGGFGWLAGAAYERPDIALRVALTYSSEIEHEFTTTENLAPTLRTTTTSKTPQSVNLDFQTGVAKKTLVMGNIRWAQHSVTRLRPSVADVDLIEMDDSTTYTLGVAHRFNARVVGSLSYTYDDLGGDTLVSPLAPTSGSQSITLGLRYELDKVRISAGIRYTDLSDAMAETGTPDTARAAFNGNDALSFGLKVGFTF